MGYETISSGITLVIPTSGTKNWGTTVKNSTWEAISSHDHTGSGSGSQLGSGSLLINTQQTATPTGTTQTIDFVLGHKAKLDLGSASGDVTLTLDTPSTGGDYRIVIIQGATPRVVTWPATVIWPGGEEPTQHMLLNSKNMVWLDYDGTNYYGRFDVAFA